MKRPDLRTIPLDVSLLRKPGVLSITMSRGQWDALLAEMYARGHLLVELDENENPVAMYQRDLGRPSSA